MKKWIACCSLSLVIMQCFSQQKPLYQSGTFAIYPDKVVQGKFEGKALSATELASNYKSPANEFLSPAITFKFSINGKDNTVEHYITVDAPTLTHTNNTISWNAIKGAKQYKVLKNGKEVSKTNKTDLSVTSDNYAEYQIIALDEKGVESFASEPLLIAGRTITNIYEMENNATKASQSYKGFSGDGFVEISKNKNTEVTIPPLGSMFA